jgi:hypothetical protein
MSDGTISQDRLVDADSWVRMEQVEAVAEGTVSLMRGGGTMLCEVVVDQDGGLMVVWPIGEHLVLATSTVDRHRVRLFVEGHAELLAQAAP